MSRPLRSPPITGASALLRAGPPACPHRYSTPHSFCCSTRSLSPPATFSGSGSPYRHTPSHVPCSSRRPGSRRLHTGHHLASKRAPARLLPKIYTDLGFDVVSSFSMLHQRIALARLPDPCLTAFTPPFRRVAPGISARGSHRSVRKPLDLHGSCHPVHQTLGTEGTHSQCANIRGNRSTIPRRLRKAFLFARSRLYFLRIQRIR